MLEEIKDQLFNILKQELESEDLWYRVKSGINSNFFNEYIILPIMEKLNQHTEKYTKYLKIAFAIQILIIVLLLIIIILLINNLKLKF